MIKNCVRCGKEFRKIRHYPHGGKNKRYNPGDLCLQCTNETKCGVLE